jgi:triosephosphate isomerase
MHLLPVKQFVEKHIHVTSQNVILFPEGAYAGEVTVKIFKNAALI